ncbi:MAG: hypothetical protein ABI581_07320 [Sediminibacterium sp.]
MKKTEPVSTEQKTRRTLLSGIGLLSIFSFFRLVFPVRKKDIISCAPPAEKQTMKFLTQDGVLVEVDVSNLNSSKEKISDKGLQAWIKNKQS